MSAPRDVQARVASVIPFKRFGPRTQTMMRQQFGNLDRNATVGELAARHGAAPGGAAGGVQPGGMSAEGFRDPVIGGKVISEHGAGRPGGATGRHQGIDIGAASGTNISATTDQTITQAGLIGRKYGWGVKTIDAQGREHVYAHMRDDPSKTFGLAPGQKVPAGTLLGAVGQSGNARTTPPHLHYEVRPREGAYAQSYDPRRFLPFGRGAKAAAPGAAAEVPLPPTRPVEPVPTAPDDGMISASMGQIHLAGGSLADRMGHFRQSENVRNDAERIGHKEPRSMSGRLYRKNYLENLARDTQDAGSGIRADELMDKAERLYKNRGQRSIERGSPTGGVTSEPEEPKAVKPMPELSPFGDTGADQLRRLREEAQKPIPLRFEGELPMMRERGMLQARREMTHEMRDARYTSFSDVGVS